MVGIAHSFGDLKSILPKGMTRLLDCPWTISLAIEHARMILGWYENLPSDDRPPKEIWNNERRLKEWFDARFGKKGKGKKEYDTYVSVE